MKFDDFEAAFRPSVRVLFDWDLARDLSLLVDVEVIGGGQSIGHLFTPWYAGEERTDAYLEGQCPLKLQDLTEDPSLLDQRRRDKISMLAERLAQTDEAILVASYCFGHGTILLEGNHRMAAKHLTRLQNPIIAIRIDGPCDESILPDLRNFSANPGIRRVAGR